MVLVVLLYIWEPMRTVADEMERREWVYRFILVRFHLVGGRGSVLSSAILRRSGAPRGCVGDGNRAGRDSRPVISVITGATSR